VFLLQALEAHAHSIQALEDENARLLDEITGIKAKDLEQDGQIESLGEVTGVTNLPVAF